MSTVFDKQTESYIRTNSSVERAKKYFSQLTKAPLREMGNLTFAKSLEDALELPNYIIESLPENLKIKQHLYKEIEEISIDSIIRPDPQRLFLRAFCNSTKFLSRMSSNSEILCMSDCSSD